MMIFSSLVAHFLKPASVEKKNGGLPVVSRATQIAHMMREYEDLAPDRFGRRYLFRQLQEDEKFPVVELTLCYLKNNNFAAFKNPATKFLQSRKNAWLDETQDYLQVKVIPTPTILKYDIRFHFAGEVENLATMKFDDVEGAIRAFAACTNPQAADYIRAITESRSQPANRLGL